MASHTNRVELFFVAVSRRDLVETTTVGGGGRLTEGDVDGRVDPSHKTLHTTLRRVVWSARGFSRRSTSTEMQTVYLERRTYYTLGLDTKRSRRLLRGGAI